eukprot:5690-Lingulodinium_polyedra.AAC.1
MPARLDPAVPNPLPKQLPRVLLQKQRQKDPLPKQREKDQGRNTRVEARCRNITPLHGGQTL